MRTMHEKDRRIRSLEFELRNERRANEEMARKITQLRAQIGTEIRTKGVVQQSHDWLYREKARLESTLRKIANPNTVAGMNDQDRAPKLQRIAQAAISVGTEAPNTQD
jgi:predicted RNase H-like nuclease (RuvC/YqgF family)